MSGSDVSDTIVAKSDQLNADDLLAGPIVVTITAVKRSTGETAAQQPIEIHIGGGRQPFKPCKTVRRILVSAWGSDSSKWIGRSMKLYRDPKVKWGGVEVGGIRVSALSHISATLSLSLTETRKTKVPVKIAVLEGPPEAASTSFLSMKGRWKSQRESLSQPVSEIEFRNFVATATSGAIAADKALIAASYSNDLLSLCDRAILGMVTPTGHSEDVRQWVMQISRCGTETTLTALHNDFDAARDGRATADIEAIEAAFASRLEELAR